MNLNDILLELRKYNISNLEDQTGLSRSHIYGILNGKIDPSLKTLQKLINPLGVTIEFNKKSDLLTNNYLTVNNEEFLVWNLAKYGAPLSADKYFDYVLDINRTATLAIDFGRKSPKINTVLPTFLYKNRKLVDWKLIVKSISDKRYLAYLVNLIFHFTNDLEMADLLQDLRSKVGRIIHSQRLIRRSKISKFEIKKLESVENMIADSWKYQTADSLKGLEDRFKKWNFL